MRTLKGAIVCALVIGAAAGTALAAGPGPHFGAWGAAQKIDEIAGNHPDLNTAFNDGCPIQSPDALHLYLASNRPGGKGAVFEVVLPVASPAESGAGGRAEEPGDGKGAPPHLRGRRILLVEDERDSRELIAMYLSGCGADVVAVSSADDAITSLEEQPPDLLISDIAMPGKSGYDLIREVRSLPPEEGGEIPAVALTAYAAREDVDQALRAGFDVHIAKPVEMRELARKAANLILDSGAE